MIKTAAVESYWEREIERALEPVPDVPTLPRVLLIGDSISLLYTRLVRKHLEHSCNLHRVPANGQDSDNVVRNLHSWLGPDPWAAVHFNCGLWDIKALPDGTNAVPVKRYEENLRLVVQQLRRTPAALIWASTTPVPADHPPWRRQRDVEQYNDVAAAVMREAHVQINDLFALVDTRPELQLSGDAHLSPAGDKLVASQVADSILVALRRA